MNITVKEGEEGSKEAIRKFGVQSDDSSRVRSGITSSTPVRDIDIFSRLSL